jgi:hypothetical protein
LDKLPQDIKKEFLEFLTAAQAEQIEFVKESAIKLKEWTALYLSGELNAKEFNSLLRAHNRTIKQKLNTLEIEARARVEKILFGLLDVVMKKVLV